MVSGVISAIFRDVESVLLPGRLRHFRAGCLALEQHQAREGLFIPAYSIRETAGNRDLAIGHPDLSGLAYRIPRVSVPVARATF